MKPQNKRKLKPKLRFPEFRDVPEWKIKEVGQVTRKLLDGDWIESNDQSKNGVRLIQTGNIGIGEFISKNDSARYVSEDTFNRLNCTEVFPGDCLISRLPDPVGRSCLLPNIGQRMITAVDCAIARFDLKKIIPHIFVSYSQTHQYLDRVNSLSSGSTRKRISRENLSKIEIPLPEIPEQQKIADCLSSLDELIAAQTQKLDTLKDHKKGLLQQLFPAEGKTLPQLRFPEFRDAPEWETNKFSKYIVLYRGSSPRPIQEYLTKSDSGVSWIKIGDTKNADNYIINQVKEKITPKGAEKSRKVSKGELILANSMSFGKTYQLAIDGYIYDGWFVLREYEKYFHEQFLFQLLNSEYMQNQYVRLSAGGIVQNISSDIVYNTTLPHTSFSEQQQIADCLISVDDLIASQTEKLDALKEHKKGLLQQLFPSPDEVHG